MLVTLLLVIAAIFGLVAVIDANGRSWAGWGVLVGFGILAFARLSGS